MKWWTRLFEEIKPEPKPEMPSDLASLLKLYKQAIRAHAINDCQFGRVGTNPFKEELISIEKALEKFL